jgi:hypothetical protein
MREERMLRIAMLLLVAVISTAQAQVSRTVLGPVDLSCEKWTSTPKPSPESDVYQAWVFGLISGINLESTDKDFLQGRNLAAVIAWMDNYCRSNPLVAVPQAAQELSKVLRAGR